MALFLWRIALSSGSQRPWQKIADYETPVRLNPITQNYFEGMAKLEIPEIQQALAGLAGPEAMQAVQALQKLNPLYHSMLRDSIAATVLKSGFRNNVLPSEAEAILYCRL